MPGAPLQAAFAASVAEHGEDALIFDRLAEGTPIRKLCVELGISWMVLYRWRNQSDERKRKWAEALKAGAYAIAEDAGEILDACAARPTAELIPARVAIETKRADHRWRMAAVRDSETFGFKAAGVNVNVSVGDLHIQALTATQAPQLPASAPAQLEAGATVEADILPEDEDAA